MNSKASLSNSPSLPELNWLQQAGSSLRETHLLGGKGPAVAPHSNKTEREREAISFFFSAPSLLSSVVVESLSASSDVQSSQSKRLLHSSCCCFSSSVELLRQRQASTSPASRERGDACCPKKECSESAPPLLLIRLPSSFEKSETSTQSNLLRVLFFVPSFSSQLFSPSSSLPFPRWAEEEADEEAVAEAAEVSPSSAGAAEAEASTRSGRAALPMEEAGASPIFFFSIRINLSCSLSHSPFSPLTQTIPPLTLIYDRGRGGRGRGGRGGGGGGRGDGSGRNNGNFFGNRDEGEQAAVRVLFFF